MAGYDIIVVGGGHAGCEAAIAAARLGCSTVLISSNYDNIALMSCNPAIGGLAKGHLVKELDILGGAMARVTDLTAVQYRRLNTKKGAAVQSLRAQVDKHRYRIAMRNLVEKQEGIRVKEARVIALIVEGDRVVGVVTDLGERIEGRAVILSCGTFLNGVCHVGMHQYKAGRVNDFAVEGFSDHLAGLGFTIGRLKTGTVPRLDRRSIDFDRLEVQPGDEECLHFSYRYDGPKLSQLPCYITYTNPAIHEMIEKNLDRSPLYQGVIKGRGPRYCPSIEDKIVRFPERDRHQIFIEPEGIETNETYLNGMSTSLPQDVQEKMVRLLPGCEQARIIRYGYAVEYDYLPPLQLRPWLETKRMAGLFIAGQLNGTSGYEEAAVQGFIAGVNAVRTIQQKDPIVLGRADAYIGVLIDDLISKGTDEPYRMFTSRAEYRLLLREDNVAERLLPIAEQIGLIDPLYRQAFDREQQDLAGLNEYLHRHKVSPDPAISSLLEEAGCGSLRGSQSLYELIRRPQVDEKILRRIAPELPLGDELIRKATIMIRYEGYVQRERSEVARLAALEMVVIPDDFDYPAVANLSNEVREKLTRIRPHTLGQAGRISGVTPASISVLMVRLKYLGCL